MKKIIYDESGKAVGSKSLQGNFAQGLKLIGLSVFLIALVVGCITSLHGG